MCALAEVKNSWRSAKAWAAISVIAVFYVVFAICGAGKEPLIWGAVLIALGVPVYYLGRQRAVAIPAPA
jgi:APA family basic amino acid/polyamine antiporter